VAAGMRRGVPEAEIVRKSGAGLVVAGDPEPLGSAIGRLTADLNLARSRSRTIHSRTFQLGSRRCPDGRFVCQPRTSRPAGRICKCLIKLPSSAEGAEYKPTVSDLAYSKNITVVCKRQHGALD
jgi:hypothetical protein